MSTIVDPTTPMPTLAGLPGIRFRHFRGIDDDIPGMAAANQAARVADGEAAPIDIEDMRSTYEHLERSDPARDICVVEIDGVIAGYARVDWDDLIGGTRDYWSVILLGPAIRRPDVIRAIHEWTEERRRAIAVGHLRTGDGLDRPRRFATECLDGDAATSELLGLTGYEPYRRFATLVRPHFEGIAVPPMPVGIEVRPIVPDGGLMRRIFDAETEAFREEFNAHDPTEIDFARFLAEPGQDLTLWSIGSKQAADP